MIYRKCSVKRALSARPSLEFTAVDNALCMRPIVVSCPSDADVLVRNALRRYDVGSTCLDGANEVAFDAG